MNYLTRPVFQFAVNWANEVNRQFNYDLREISLGFAEPFFTGRALNVVNGWRITVELTTETDIAAFDAFTEALTGRLQGFWLPVPMRAVDIVAGVSATEFDIRDQNLRLSWQDSPDIHLYFDDGTTQQCARIAAVALVGDLERVTVDTPLSPAPGVNTDVYRLHYVRLSQDTEQAAFVRELHQSRPVQVVELPTEYAGAETGERPIYLYHFWSPAPVDYHWYYTSFAADVISGDITHRSAAISHGELKQSMSFEAESVELSAAYEADHPLSLFLPVPNGRPIHIQISQCSYADPDTVTKLFTGTVRRVPDKGTTLNAQCDSFLSILKQRIPGLLIKETCGYQLFEPLTCKAILAKFQTAGFITAIDNDAQPPTVTVQFRFPTAERIVEDYFAQGWIETGRRLSYEIRTVFASVWDIFAERLTLTLNAPLLKAQIGQEIQLIPGCDGQAQTCKDKFDNFIHFPGFVDIPINNPSFVAIENKTSAGDKK